MSRPESANSLQAVDCVTDEEFATMTEPKADTTEVLGGICHPAATADANQQTIADVIDHDRTIPELPINLDQDATLAEGIIASPLSGVGANADAEATIAQTIIDPTGPTKSASIVERDGLIQSSFMSPSASRDSLGQRVTKPAESFDSDRSPAKPITKQMGSATGPAERYKLADKPFAHGGLGNIWLAEDKALRRQVAFKELLPKVLRNKVIVERFLEEAQITGQLEHPGIVPIYDLGFQDNGTPFYAMKLLKGGNMDEAIDAMHKLPRGSTERQLAFTRLLRQFVSVCQAVGFAHDKGVLHRDLKPMNVMLGEFGETLVLDWGLAKLMDIIGERQVQSDRADANASDDDFLQSDAIGEEATLAERIAAEQETRTAIGHVGDVASRLASSGDAAAAGTQASVNASRRANSPTMAATAQRQVSTSGRSAGSQTVMGQVMGTPSYMPPEQAQGRVDKLDMRTDIYSLGGILYKLLTNQQPIPRGKIKDVMQTVIEGRIKPPREVDATVPAPLNAICRKAMSREQADRYQTAMKLAADVEAWLADEPISCFAEPWTEQARRWVKRHWTLVVSSGAVVVVLSLGTTLWTMLESRRVGGLRSTALAKSNDAKSAIESSDFPKATSLLTEALGQVKNESRLADVRSSLESRLDDIGRLQAAAERERIENLRNKSERRLRDISHDLDANPNFPNCQVVLTEVVALLANEPALHDIRSEAEKWLKVVDQALSQRAEIDAATARFAEFDNEVEQARIFGGRISGEDSLDDARQSREHGAAALDLFAIDFAQPDKLDPRLSLLPDVTQTKWRAGVGEVLVTLAQLEMKLAAKDDADDQKGAAMRSLARLVEAEKFGIASPAVWYLRADLHLLLGDEAAEQADQVAAAITEAKTRLDHFLMGERSRALRKYDEALSHYQDALRVDPDDYWSLNLMGLSHLLSGRHAAAAASYTACISRRPDFIWPYLTRAVAFGELKQFDNSYRDFERALELDPQSYAAYLNRGVVRVMDKNLPAARADFDKAAQLKPDFAAPHINLAEVAWRAGAELLSNDPSADAATRAAAEFQKGLASLTTAAKLSPQQGSTYHFRGLVQVALNATDAAQADFERAHKLELNPLRRAASFKEIGRLHHRAGRFAEALKAYDQSLAANADDHDVTRLRAEALLSLGRLEDAVAGFTKYLETRGPVGDVYRARGLALAQLKKYREAINDYTMSLQYEPSSNMLTRRGWAYLLEAAKLAKEDFEEAVRLNPENPDTYQGLAYALVMLGDYEAAVEQAEKPIAGVLKAVAQLGPRAWPLLFNPATVYAQAVAKVLVDPKLQPDRRDELAKQYAARTVELLIEAHRAAGLQFRAIFLQSLRTDSALDPIRQRREFQESLKTIDPESP